ncbi:uncharacterized protein UTRI_05127 [Ustilago trichophora]|uniref:Wings apart-like protein C-terminal domain-containing protein n=1 Tax=Ustilago trichophora TaxID=86804 RepID=A0A5C3EBA7_9BASI|nr:uncharacterized protein UTRI_05127 [Ustilago trichophora]
MDTSSSLRRKHTTVTYRRRNRAVNNSAHFIVASSSGSSDDDDEARPSNTQARRFQVTPASPSSQPQQTSHLSPNRNQSHQSTTNDHDISSPLSAKQSPSTTINGISTKLSATATPSHIHLSSSSSRAASNSASLSSPALFPKPGPSSAKLSSTKSLPQRPARAASPSPSKADRRSTASNLSAKRSASSSPRKQSSVSPSKRQARSRTPSRPAQDLASLFDAIQPTLPQPRNPFAKSESQPVVHLHQDDDETPLGEATAYANSPLPSPALPSNSFDDAQLLSPGTLTSPSKRPRMADRMAPRAARSTKSKVDDIAQALLDSRTGSLRRTETAPSALSDAGSHAPIASDGERPDSLTVREDVAKSGRQSDAGSTRFDTGSQTDSQSQETAGSSLGARRLAGIKQSSASNAKRTYGLQRSFLADQAEENLLTESAPQPSSSTAPQNIEDEIEAELKANGMDSAAASRPSIPVAARLSGATPAPPRESYAELLKKWGEGADDIEWDESQDPTLNLKSITSLRSQGELRRFNDDLEYLFSGLGPSQGLSIRKSSAVELVRLLCGKPDIGSLHEDGNDADEEVEDPLASAQSADFLRKLKASDLMARVFDLFKGAEAGEGVDDVLDASIALYVAKLLKTASSAEALMRERWSELFHTLRELLVRAGRHQRQERKDGFALLRLHELKQHKIASRSDCKTLNELRSTARISKLFMAGSKSWTLRNLVLAACCSLIVLPRRLLTEAAISDLLIGESGAEDHSPDSLFITVLNIVVSEGGKAQQRLIDFGKGLELVTSAAVEAIPDLETVDVCIRFLDKGMDILYMELDQAVPASSETLEALQHLISFAIQAAPFGARTTMDDAGTHQTGASPTRALQVLHGLFKTLLDLSQVDANWSESLAFSQPLQTSIMRAFLLSHRSATQHRHTPSVTNGIKRGKNKAQEAARDIINVLDGSHEPDAAHFDDVIHLSLALLTNLLIKQLDKARDTLESIRLDPLCWQRRNCALSCACPDRPSALQLLSRVFFETRLTAINEDDSNSAYLSNSIATAIAQFAVGGPDRLAVCKVALDAEQDEQGVQGGGFQTLLDAVEEFAVIHQAALSSTSSASDRLESAEMQVDQEKEEESQGDSGSNGNPVAMEAGQLIKDLALTLGQMA